MIVQHLDENTGAYREGKYEEYNASERNLTVTNILNQIK